jgi:hypothetical protein
MLVFLKGFGILAIPEYAARLKIDRSQSGIFLLNGLSPSLLLNTETAAYLVTKAATYLAGLYFQPASV